MEQQPSYKRTFFDKHGPDAANTMKALMFASVVFGLSLVMFYVLFSLKLGYGGFKLIGYTLGSAITLSGAAAWMGLKTGGFAGEGAQRVYLGGDSTPYEDQFSQEQALVMQRDYAGALHMFEQRIIATPTDIRVLVAAADLYVKHGDNPRRAAQLYKEVQRQPDVPGGQDIYVSNKLADLYLGALNEPGRALVEFRRLMSRYPGSTTAKHARMALDNLKPDMVKGPDTDA